MQKQKETCVRSSYWLRWVRVVVLSLVVGILTSLSTASPADGAARTVKYHDKDIVAIRAKLRYTTLIALPADEKIVQAATGDRDFWVIDAVQNFCFLHPAKSGIHSNLNLITDKGTVYSFTLDEVTDEPDLKIIVEPSGASALSSVDPNRKFVSATEIEAYKSQAQAAQTQAQEAVARFKSEYPTKQMKFDYLFRDQKPFAVAAIYHDDNFTYIKSTAAEKFSLYEVKDDQANFVNFDLRDGTYVVPKVMEKGYLEIGKKRLTFERKPE
jgi:type IV secretion system protein VirB9